jgi:hypothetical protein
MSTHALYHHTNPSMRRIRASLTGVENYAPMHARLIDYDASMSEYGDVTAVTHPHDPATGAHAAAGAAKEANMWTGLWAGIGQLGGAIGGAAIMGGTQKAMNNATIQSQEKIALAQIDSNNMANQLAASFSAQTGGKGKYIVMAVVGVAVIGGAGYFMLRKK